MAKQKPRDQNVSRKSWSKSRHELPLHGAVQHGVRRASMPEPSQVMATSSDAHGAFMAPVRVPLPLPYSPTDYLPSPTSPRHFLLTPPPQPGPSPLALLDTAVRTGASATGPAPVPVSVPMGAFGAARPRSQSTDSRHALLPPEDAETSTPKQHFELVPYREWTVISRDDALGNIVLYNQEHHQVSVQQYLPTPGPPNLADECPTCHRPFDTPKNFQPQPTFMDRNYFRLLERTPLNAAETPTRTSFESTQGSEPPLFEADGSAMHLHADAINQGYYAKFFKEVKKLGRGFRGSVFLCEHMLDGVNLGKYAVKKVAIGNNHPWLVKMLREVHLLERLHHPNVVSYKHSWLEYDRLTPFGPQVPCLFILMECANGGNLEEYLEPEVVAPKSHEGARRKSAKELKRERIQRQLQQQEDYEAELKDTEPIHTQKRLLSIAEIFSLFLDIVQGLAHLHLQHIVHRDLKPPNLLLKWDDRRRKSDVFNVPRVLISDFGECEDLEAVPDSDRTGATGTLEFMAPEHARLDAQGRNVVEYSSKADMWSLGMVLYYLCYSCLPYTHINDVDLLREEILNFKEIKFPKSRLDAFHNTPLTHRAVSEIPQEFKLLIRVLLSTDPAKRPSCQEILSKLDTVPFNHDRFTSMDASASTSSKSSAAPDASASSSSPTSLSFDRRRSSSFHPGTSLPPSAHHHASYQREPRQSRATLLGADEKEHLQAGSSSTAAPEPSTSTSTSTSAPSPGMITGIKKRVARDEGMRKRAKLTNNATSLISARREPQSREKIRSATSPLLLISPNDIPAHDTMDYLYDLPHWKPVAIQALKYGLFLLKITSCLYPCLPYSAKMIVFYPLIILAVADFWW
ncbi:kinase-like domain-containing protein [Gongronella butleri]|nr:kinase-like domain-containing protein [Gongronella butleri]